MKTLLSNHLEKYKIRMINDIYWNKNPSFHICYPMGFRKFFQTRHKGQHFNLATLNILLCSAIVSGMGHQYINNHHMKIKRECEKVKVVPRRRLSLTAVHYSSVVNVIVLSWSWVSCHPGCSEAEFNLSCLFSTCVSSRGKSNVS